MRSANLLNDFAFKYVFGEDCKEANDALKSLLTVFLESKGKSCCCKEFRNGKRL